MSLVALVALVVALVEARSSRVVWLVASPPRVVARAVALVEARSSRVVWLVAPSPRVVARARALVVARSSRVVWLVAFACLVAALASVVAPRDISNGMQPGGVYPQPDRTTSPHETDSFDL